ncbi:MAG: right-handed parallel beta-helix repeat-containing protein [Verrucomicrobiae bacterium]|nr:right-handed parallel beta-helix repeat-containing protein [Verrucomicrobiae bacterium]
MRGRCGVRWSAWWLGIVLLVPSASAAIWHVRSTGSDAASGSSWTSAKRSVAAALAQSSEGDEVWVAAGIYFERIALQNEVALYGGFEGTETARDQRDFNRHLTILDGEAAGTVVRCESAGATPATRLDGFVVRNGRGVLGGGIACTATSPTLANNLITGNVSLGPGGGICCYNGANPVILNNRILGNRAEGDDADGGGIACMAGRRGNLGSSPWIVGNLIARNQAGENGGGIVARDIFVSEDGQVVVPSAPRILNNILAENIATQPPLGDRSLGGGAIACVNDGMAEVVANNLIVANSGWQAGGILLVGGARDHPQVINNTLAGNSGPALRWLGVRSIRIANNLIAFNAAGLSRSIDSPGGPVTASHNLLHGNQLDYDGLADLTGQDGNLSFDPRFAGFSHGDYRLTATSPCIQAGDDSAVASDWRDLHGQPRIRGGRVDIGAEEWDGNVRVPLLRVLRVHPSGDDLRDGASWTGAKRTIAAAIAALHEAALDAAPGIGGGEIWVAAGTYRENLVLPPHVHLYGGFVGGEITRAERNPDAHATVIDGTSRNRVLLIWGGHRVHTVDGFRVQGGRLTGGPSDQGGGMECYYSGPRIAGCTVTGNVANLGGAIGGFGADPWITDCRLTDNAAGADGRGLGGGIHLDRSLGTIERCVLARNAASDGGGLFASFSQPRILDCEIADNSGKGISLWNSRGLGWTLADRLEVARNRILRNVTSHEGAGLHVLFCAGRIVNNLVLLNRSGTLEGGGYGGGMSLTGGEDGGGTLLVAHNSILGNTAEFFGLNFGGGIHLYLLAHPTLVLANNIIAHNSSGLFNRQASPVSPLLVRNNVFANQDRDYQTVGAFGIPGAPLFHPSDLSVDPRFRSLDGDFRLQPGSLCIDAGDPAFAPENDADGLPRPLDGDADGFPGADLGAYEMVHPTVVGQIQFPAPTAVVHMADGECRLTLRRTVGLATAVAVPFATFEGTARAGTDFEAVQGQVTLAGGQSVAEIRIPLHRDRLGLEPRTFTVRLSDPGGTARLGSPAEVLVTLHPVRPWAEANPWNIPDSWIQQHGLVLTATSDADGDGFLDRFEYVAGTDPTRADSLLRLLSVTRGPDGRALIVTWSSVPGKRYAVRRSSSLTGAGPFGTPMVTGLTASGAVTSWTSPPGTEPHGFLLVEVEP